MNTSLVRKCVDCGYHLTEYYPPGAKRCARCQHIARGLLCRTCHTNKQAPLRGNCDPCEAGRKRAYKESGKTRAGTILHAAIKRQLLPPAKALTCVDCGKQAHGYDHRDYSRPLDVVPVCASCNGLRGHAENLAALINKYCLSGAMA